MISSIATVPLVSVFSPDAVIYCVSSLHCPCQLIGASGLDIHGNAAKNKEPYSCWFPALCPTWIVFIEYRLGSTYSRHGWMCVSIVDGLMERVVEVRSFDLLPAHKFVVYVTFVCSATHFSTAPKTVRFAFQPICPPSLSKPVDSQEPCQTSSPSSSLGAIL